MPSERSNLILVEISKRLDNLEAIRCRRVDSNLFQNVMLGLDPALCLNPVRRDRPLKDILASFFPGFFFENLVEGFSELFPFLLGGCFSFHRGEEFSARMDEPDFQGCWGSGESFFDLFGLAGPEEARVDHDRKKVIAKRFSGDKSGDGAVNSA